MKEIITEEKQAVNTGYHKALAKTLRDWMLVDDHYSIVHFSVEAGISKQKLFALADEEIELREALDYALSVQEWKIVDGVMNKIFDKSILKLLETYNGWNADEKEKSNTQNVLIVRFDGDTSSCTKISRRADDLATIDIA